jgi:integrase
MPLRRPFAARVFKPAVKRAELDPGLTFRGLRKVATSNMVDDGVHPRVIQHRLGHATARLSQELYAHVSDTADEAAASRLAERFSNATGTPRARTPSDG